MAMQDSRGRPVPHHPWGVYRLGPDEFWLFSEHRSAYDSRYFGPEEFAGTDETGRRSVCAWQSADGRIEWEKPEDGARSEPIEFVLEPGIFLSEKMGGSRAASQSPLAVSCSA